MSLLYNFQGEHEHDSSVTSVGVKVEGDVNMMMLERWIQRLITEDGANLYRYKGVISVKGMDQKFVSHAVEGFVSMVCGCLVSHQALYGTDRSSKVSGCSLPVALTR